ncbi:MAG: hypothetical protein Q9162_003432 [Coniocarpon cinnabarinum]
MFAKRIVTTSLVSLAVAQQQPISDSGVAGPPLDIAFLYNGVAVSQEGRLFSNYPAGLDPNNTNTPQTPNKYQVAELLPNGTQVPYPSADYNHPPGGALNFSTTPATSASYSDYLIGVQSVVIDSSNTLLILDTGRAVDPASAMLLPAVPGGPKLVTVDLATNQVIRTYTFPVTVAYQDSYLNDVRVDRSPNLSGLNSNGSAGVAYITDSSTEGRNGIIVVDLTSGESWRHLDGDPRVRPLEQVTPYVWGQPLFYSSNPVTMPYGHIPFGSDGIALGADGQHLFFSSIAGRYLYSIPTSALRDHSPTSELMAQNMVQNRGEKGISDGLETDSNGYIYGGNIEQEAVSIYFPSNATQTTFVRDPRINWVDTLSVGWDGYLYFTVNQLQLTSSFYPGTERRQLPYVLFKAPLPDGGKKIMT